MSNNIKYIEILQQFDNKESEQFSENEVYAALSKLAPEDNSALQPSFLAELLAFGFAEISNTEQSRWGTYFGPMLVIPNDDGTISEAPSIKLITPEMIEYWTERIDEVKHPILKARYAGIVIDFSKKIKQQSASFKTKCSYIHSLLSIAKNKLHRYPTDIQDKLKQSLSIATSLNNPDLIEKCKKQIIEYENETQELDKLGTWGLSFDLLINNRKVNLSNDEEESIINELEDKLQKLLQANNPFGVEIAADRLAIYYRKKNKHDDVKRVLSCVEGAYNRMIEQNASAIQSSAWLRQIYEKYHHFNLHEEAEKTLIRLREIGRNIKSELKPFSATSQISKEEFDKYIEAMTDGDLVTVLNRIIFQYIPKKTQAHEEILKLSKTVIVQYLFSQNIVDSRGRTVASIGSLDDDLDGHLILHISQNLHISSMFLRSVLEKTIAKFNLTPQQVVEFIKSTPIIEENRYELIEKGLENYFHGDYISASHILVPQIEEGLRNLLELAGGNIYKPSRNGGFNLRTFDDVLTDEIIKNILQEDLALYFKILLTDSKGWNLRNNICHGMLSPEAFTPVIADRIFHILLCLSLIRKQESSN